jgi:hypothetical protein
MVSFAVAAAESAEVFIISAACLVKETSVITAGIIISSAYNLMSVIHRHSITGVSVQRAKAGNGVVCADGAIDDENDCDNYTQECFCTFHGFVSLTLILFVIAVVLRRYKHFETHNNRQNLVFFSDRCCNA